MMIRRALLRLLNHMARRRALRIDASWDRWHS
jgi:hypothetical protein